VRIRHTHSLILLLYTICFGECSEKDAAEAKEKLGPQPLLPDITPVRITDDRFGRVPRVYIETLKDRALPIDVQREMYTTIPCRQVITMDSDHSPFLSQPEVLASHLKNIGKHITQGEFLR
jgi:hypothetical protein